MDREHRQEGRVIEEHGRAADWEQERHFTPRSVPSKAKAKVTVSIPVTVGGYTGQRDNWEQLERDYTVTVNDDGTVTLESDQHVKRKITFDPEALQEALGILRPSASPNDILRALDDAIKPQHTSKPLDGGLLPPFGAKFE